MFESITYESILQRMLDKVPDSFDKREASVIYDALAPAAVELQLLYIQLDVFLKETFGHTASRTYLIERAAERGIVPEPATKATFKGEFNIDVAIGARFSLDALNYVVIEKISSGVYKLQCETVGMVGNKQLGTLVPIDYIEGLTSAKLTELLIPGEDEEETETFRARYLASFDPQAYGGNIADYREKVNAISGVGGVKVYPAWQGGGTVRLAFMTSEYKVPTAEFVDQVQTLVDPIPNQGKGLGIAPIGHIVTVQGVKNSAVHVDLQMTFQGTHIFEDFRTDIQNVIDDYFSGLNKAWQSTQVSAPGQSSNSGILIRRAQIESRLLDISGVIDVQHTFLNGIEENLTLDPDALAVRGLVNGS